MEQLKIKAKTESDFKYISKKQDDVIKSNRKYFDQGLEVLPDDVLARNNEIFDQYNKLRDLNDNTACGFEIGDGATIPQYSDSHAYTVIGISKSGKQITLQRDISTRKEETKPHIVIGGFSGNCTNNHSIEYDYERNTNGRVVKARLLVIGKGTDNEKTKWVEVGRDKYRSGSIYKGRNEFYDYNF